jgi:hypothetical protein
MHAPVEMLQADIGEYCIPFKQRRYARSSLFIQISATSWIECVECTTSTTLVTNHQVIPFVPRKSRSTSDGLSNTLWQDVR